MNATLLKLPIGTPCPDRDRRLNELLVDMGYERYIPADITPPKPIEPWVIPVSQSDED